LDYRPRGLSTLNLINPEKETFRIGKALVICSPSLFLNLINSKINLLFYLKLEQSILQADKI